MSMLRTLVGEIYLDLLGLAATYQWDHCSHPDAVTIVTGGLVRAGFTDAGYYGIIPVHQEEFKESKAHWWFYHEYGLLKFEELTIRADVFAAIIEARRLQKQEAEKLAIHKRI